MDTSLVLRTVRSEAGLTLRALGRAAGTSHSALAAYESGSKVPSTATLDRIVRAAGFRLDVHLARRVSPVEPLARGQELEAVLELAAEFPARHALTLVAPIFSR